MLISFEFEQYRSFLSPARVALGRKLTLLYGYNNVGKSALLRGLVLMAASCNLRSATEGEPLALVHAAARGARFQDLVSRTAAAKRMRVGLAWADADVQFTLLDVFKASDAVGTPIVEKIVSEAFGLDAEWQPNEALAPTYDGQKGPEDIRFNGLLPEGASYAGLRARLEAFGTSVRWLPTRGAPKPRYVADGTQYAPESPIPHLERLGQDHEVYKDVQSALDRIAGVELMTARDAQGAYAEIAPRGLPGRSVPLSSVGEGIVQVLPVVTLAAMARRGQLGKAPVVAIEQPELHLHPAAELALVDVLLEACEGDARFVLETHSETLLLGLQLAVAQRKLAPVDVSVCLVESDAGLSTVREIPLRLDGSRQGWPPGVFSEHLEQARKILEAREGLER